VPFLPGIFLKFRYFLDKILSLMVSVLWLLINLVLMCGVALVSNQVENHKKSSFAKQCHLPSNFLVVGALLQNPNFSPLFSSAVNP
jgi:hypothetical protein